MHEVSSGFNSPEWRFCDLLSAFVTTDYPGNSPDITPMKSSFEHKFRVLLVVFLYASQIRSIS